MSAECSGYGAGAVAGVGLNVGISTLTVMRGIDVIIVKHVHKTKTPPCLHAEGRNVRRDRLAIR
ncbi:hypothetical protein GCM10010981_19550 [Dyella nitratireducens]|uniref:Uncharacterized protein n=1 Tax=Dyella nitratireducens TaxID=1849580 RepID=A0ABQ1FV57_9GAMM|nr:hypothetical protein GCM10010981_19550 [Dyella nitratireducens]GLQ42982.1 hypothetical protein GCM10007902_28320 [Dyella nitratireducens]